MLYLFYRKDSVYPIELKSDEKALEHIKFFPDVLKIEKYPKGIKHFLKEQFPFYKDE